LPESFIWVRLFQICTFGALFRPDMSPQNLDRQAPYLFRDSGKQRRG